MTFTKGLKLGINSYSKAFQFIKKYKLTWYFLFPLVLNIILFTLGYSSTVSLSTKWFVYVSDWLCVDSWNFWGSGFLSSMLLFFLNIVLRLLFIIIFAYIGGYVVIILMSPVYAILSEKVETIITGNDYPFEFNQFIKDIWRGIRLATRNFLIELLLTIVLLLLSFLPVIGLFTSLTLFIISSYFYGFSFIDYSLERKKLNMNESIAFVKTNKGLAIGNGTIFSLVLLIPFVGVLISSFVSIITLVAATITTTQTLVIKQNE
ncbi:EI24 domain-containing protein [Plebeiibacterium sediminum]|uniref:EI24 domain-containing protein n=1 Tax=Plebeiibacterium sediminum TaxID=2992112 RepID=A0AAE3M7A7_9BACT|nr:EI24 domain-containing protein [Plebeiobacterium sediminum]MCW3788606.1 EI24 domain-containing protein [Plebeiobacterium sediminum]